MKSLLLGPSAILFDRSDPSIFFCAVGSYIRIYKSDEVIKSVEIFPSNVRIVGLRQLYDNIYAYAESFLSTFHFERSSFSLVPLESYTLSDHICTVSPGEQITTVVLNHSQVVSIQGSKTSEIPPPIWKIATSAFVYLPSIFIGDSFGTISSFDPSNSRYFERETSFGVVFGIDYDKSTSNLVTAHEYHTVALWKVNESSFDLIWSEAPHPSRVWGVKFLPCGPVSFGEDGRLCIFDGSKRSFDLHRTKNVTAFDFTQSCIITAGQDCSIRRIPMPKAQKIPQTFEFVAEETKSPKPKSPKAVAALSGGKCIVATHDGSIVMLPSNEILEHSSQWYLLSSRRDDVVAASRDFRLFVFRNSPTVFESQRKKPIVSLDIEGNFVFALYSDNFIAIYHANGTLICEVDLNGMFSRVPLTIAASVERSLVALGSRCNYVQILKFKKNFEGFIGVEQLTVASDSGFQHLLFTNKGLYCSGRTDGVVSICGFIGDSLAMKSVWRIPAQCNAAIKLEELENGSVVVSAMKSDHIVVVDIGFQTIVAEFPFKGQKTFLSIRTSQSSVTSAWCDLRSVTVIADEEVIPTVQIGSFFHGLRGLCSAFFGGYLVTGSCDRDVRVWKLGNNIECVDIVQAIDSGTHAMCFANDGTMFSGGSKQILFVWKLIDGKLFRQKEIDLGSFEESSKCKRRIVSLCVFNNDKLLIGMSDAKAIICSIGADIKCLGIEKISGVPISCDSVEGSVIVATSTGCMHFINAENKMIKIWKCGLHCVKALKCSNGVLLFISADDGSILCRRYVSGALEDICTIVGTHIGGIKAIDAKWNGEENVRLASFSYDQNAFIIDVNIKTGSYSIVEKVVTNICYGEAVNFISGDHYALFGSGIELH